MLACSPLGKVSLADWHVTDRGQALSTLLPFPSHQPRLRGALIEQRLAEMSSSVNPSVRWAPSSGATSAHYRAIAPSFLPLERTLFGAHGIPDLPHPLNSVGVLTSHDWIWISRFVKRAAVRTRPR